MRANKKGVCKCSGSVCARKNGPNKIAPDVITLLES